MNDEDYAIVVGIQRYPMFGRTERVANDLQGPDLDATDVYNWLTDPAKGGVKPEHATLIRSQDYPNPFPVNLQAEPQLQAITNAFDRLDSLAQQNNEAGKGLRVGRRLYIYMAGHGFAKQRATAAVFTANATRTRTHHIFGSAWSEAFANTPYFQEVVLWMDCCLAPEVTVHLQEPPLRTTPTPGAGARLFAAYAAQLPLLAVERRMSDGRIHGVFTYTLLQGLNGAAADERTKHITSESLRAYLTNAMKTFMSEADQLDPTISSSPDFGPVDPIVFGLVLSVPTHTVTLRFPAAAAGFPFRVQTGSPPQVVAQEQIPAPPPAAGAPPADPIAVVNLPTGVYWAQVEALGLAQGFQVLGEVDVPIGIGS